MPPDPLVVAPSVAKSQLMATGFAAGEAVHAFLSQATRAQLSASEHVRLERDVRAWAARAAYAGLALWTIGALAERPRLRDLGEAMAGVGIGLMPGRGLRADNEPSSGNRCRARAVGPGRGGDSPPAGAS